jgi:dTDP-4-dehydrorhamnose 3,5-epimerase
VGAQAADEIILSSMKSHHTPLPGLIVLEPATFEDERGWFIESFNQRLFDQLVGQHVNFVQDNHSFSHLGVLRGLHFQAQQAQGKLVRVVQGKVFDVVIDIRPDSLSFGQWVGVYLSAENKRQLWIPAGLAHGFLTLSNTAEFLYKTTDYYAPAHERCLAWNDPHLAIEWPLGILGGADGIQAEPVVSTKDATGMSWADLCTSMGKKQTPSSGSIA